MSTEKRPATIDAAWLFAKHLQLFEVFGHRADVADLVRWHNPDIAESLDANHAALAPGAPLIPSQLTQLIDRQRADGVRACLDLYGDVSGHEEMLAEFGLKPLHPQPSRLLVWSRRGEVLPALPADDKDRPVPAREAIAADDWVELVRSVYRGEATDQVIAHAMCEALAPRMRFYAVKVGDRGVTAMARFDYDEISQVGSVYTDPDFRKTGFAVRLGGLALSDSPHDRVFIVATEANLAVMRVIERFRGHEASGPLIRRYVG